MKHYCAKPSVQLPKYMHILLLTYELASYNEHTYNLYYVGKEVEYWSNIQKEYNLLYTILGENFHHEKSLAISPLCLIGKTLITVTLIFLLC